MDGCYLTRLFPGIQVPLIRAANGHLLLHLTKDCHETHDSVRTVIHYCPDEKETNGQDGRPVFEIKVVETHSDSSSDVACVPADDDVTMEHGCRVQEPIPDAHDCDALQSSAQAGNAT